MSKLLELEHINLKYGDIEVLTNVTASLEQHSFTALVGPNGAGKTQLMRLMLGLIQPTTGTIARHFSMDEVGYVPQRLSIDNTLPLTVKEFIQLYREPYGFWRLTPLPTFDSHFSIEQLLDRPLGKLSGGQLQRVLLATVLTTKPTLLFLDEFSAGIDPRGQAELFNFLHRLNEKDGMTIVMISHDLEIVSQYADTVLCLNKELICHGHPKTIFTAETLEKMYGIPLTKLHHHHDS